MRRSTFFLVSVASTLLVAACGSSDKGGLFEGSGGASSGGTGNSESGGSSASGGSSGSDGGGPSGGSSGSDGGGPSGGTAGIDGGAPNGGGPTGGSSGSDGGRPNGGAPGGGGVPSGGAPGGGGANPGGGGTGGSGNTTCSGHCGQFFTEGCQCDEQCSQAGDCCGDYASSCLAGLVECGNSTCKLGDQFCCQSFVVSSWQPQCVGTFCAGTEINCDGPEDCDGGQVCCAQISAGGNYFTDFTCQAAASCTGNRRVVCGSSPGVCPGGTTCKATNSPPGYNYCGF